MSGRRRTWVGIGAVLVVVLGAVTLVWFQPQKLFYDERVEESLPTAVAEEPAAGGGGAVISVAPSGPVDLAAGTFLSREHETVGTARVVRLPDGQVVVRLEGFETSNGPALFVYLSQNPADGEESAFDEQFVDLGVLKGNVGDQNYPVPAGVDATGYLSVVIWCDRFDAAFGAADLAPTTAA